MSSCKIEDIIDNFKKVVLKSNEAAFNRAVPNKAKLESYIRTSLANKGTETREKRLGKFRSNAAVTIGDVETTKPKTPLNKDIDEVNQTKEYTNHSGGADGSDTVWGEIGAEYGVKSNHYYYGSKTPMGNTVMSEEDYTEGQQKATTANRQLGRIEQTHQTRNELIIRNWNQVKYSDMVVAIGEMVSAGVELNYGKKTLIRQTKGGTGGAVQMAINEGKPVYVFDQTRDKWFKNINGKWENSTVPTLTNNFAGIGTRNINESGKQAIRDVYEKSFKSNNDNKDSDNNVLTEDLYNNLNKVSEDQKAMAQILLNYKTFDAKDMSNKEFDKAHDEYNDFKARLVKVGLNMNDSRTISMDKIDKLFGKKPNIADRYILQGKYEANKGQVALIDKTVELLNNTSDSVEDNVMIVQGMGGTGKSTTIGRAIELANEESEGTVSVVGMTITHAAKDVLKDMMKSMSTGINKTIGTVASLLGTMEIVKDGRLNYVGKGFQEAEPFSKGAIYRNAASPILEKLREVGHSRNGKVVIVIDETSMIDAATYSTLLGYVKEGKGSVKLILMGDYHQMPIVQAHKNSNKVSVSVGINVSPTLQTATGQKMMNEELTNKVTTMYLNEQQRQSTDSTLYKYINNAAVNVESLLGLEDTSPIEIDQEDASVVHLGKNKTEDLYLSEVLKEEFTKSPENTKYISFNNKTVASANSMIRKELYGEASTDLIENKEQLMLYGNFMDPNSGYTNGTQFKVSKTKDVENNGALVILEGGYNRVTYKKDTKLEQIEISNKEDNFTLIFPKGFMYEVNQGIINSDRTLEQVYMDTLNKYVNIEKVSGRYTAHNLNAISQSEKANSFELIPITYGYAITTYKSQGQTIDIVFYDNSIGSGTPKTTVAHNEYTALSRAKKKVYIVNNVAPLSKKVKKSKNVNSEVISVDSNQEGLEYGLTNPTHTSPKGTEWTKGDRATRKYLSSGIDYNGKHYADVEEAYQALKSTKEGKTKPKREESGNYKLMVNLITAKLNAYPRLITGINNKGGIKYLDKILHQPTNSNTVWETGGKDWFKKALKDAYQNVSSNVDSEFIGETIKYKNNLYTVKGLNTFGKHNLVFAEGKLKGNLAVTTISPEELKNLDTKSENPVKPKSTLKERFSVLKNKNTLNASNSLQLEEVEISTKEYENIKVANDKFKQEHPNMITEGSDFEYKDGKITVVRPTETNGITKEMYEVYTAHEIRHALTYDWIKDAKNKSKVDYLRRELKGVALLLKDKTDMSKADDLFRDRMMYAFTNTEVDQVDVAEMVAILSAEPNIRKSFMELVPQNKRTVLGKILDKINEFLGIYSKPEINSGDILSTIDNIVDENERRDQIDSMDTEDLIQSKACGK